MKVNNYGDLITRKLKLRMYIMNCIHFYYYVPHSINMYAVRNYGLQDTVFNPRVVSHTIKKVCIVNVARATVNPFNATCKHLGCSFYKNKFPRLILEK